ncbi:MAG: PilT/PilU family type 4a pilus ATPase, partial [Deltaproteobacteria bacterium]
PTGHGKSTTVACMIDIINTHRKAHIITIEDPIEFIHLNKKSIIEQREVGQDTNSFASALKHVLRQAPDVVLIGEIRDLETISIALTAAETGHLVMATLHTNDSVQTIDRLVDVFPAHQHDQIRLQISMCLKAVVAQRLIPRSDKKGQVPAVEILVNTPAVCNLIREGKTHQIYTVMETQARTGMITMDTAIKQLYRRGLVSHEDALERLKNPKNL